MNNIPKWIISASFFALVSLMIVSYFQDRNFVIWSKQFGFEPTQSTQISLDGEGSVVESNTADKRFYASESCVIGTTKAAMVIADGGAQASICGCLEESPGNSTGRGWYCFD